MDADPERERFQALFADLKRVDERTAPPFERDWQAAIARSQQPRRPALRMRLAGAIVVVVSATGIVATLLVARSHREPTVMRHDTQPAPIPQRSTVQPAEFVAGVSIPEWQSPTAFLLDDSENIRP